MALLKVICWAIIFIIVLKNEGDNEYCNFGQYTGEH